MARRARSQRGAATLVVVMVLFFLLTLVAGYTSRNLIFEQRTSANQYRSTQALEAADAGVNWALALLNAGRVDNACEPTADNSFPSFRERYLQDIADNGDITIRNRSTGVDPLMAVCVYDSAANDGDGGWECDCAADAAPTLPTVAGGDAKPMFRVRFEYAPSPAGRNVLHLVSAGCTRPDASCIQPAPLAPGGDALAVVRALITLRSALTTPPGAPLTTLGDVGGVSSLAITNLDPATQGMTIVAGGAVSGTPALTTLPGTPGSATVGDADSFLQSLSHATYATAGLDAKDLMFHSVFSMTASTYRDQPAAVRLDCTDGCNAAELSAAAAANPGRPLWAQGGDVDIDGDVGTAAAPVLLVLDTDTTDLNFISGTVHGLVHVRKTALTLGAGTTAVQGALVVEGALTGAGDQSLVYSPEVLTRLRVASGSFVRVPGGWRDY